MWLPLASPLHLELERIGFVPGAPTTYFGVRTLAPVSVDPACQSQDHGGALIRAGIEACREAGADGLIVLGHPAYYPRFGFSADAAKTVASPYAGGRSFMAMPLTPGVFDAPIRADYPPAFG